MFLQNTNINKKTDSPKVCIIEINHHPRYFAKTAKISISLKNIYFRIPAANPNCTWIPYYYLPTAA